MKEFFKVTALEDVLDRVSTFPRCDTETLPLEQALGRVLAEDFLSEVDLPDFSRSTVDGYAVRAASTFGASEGNPAYLNVKGSVAMGEIPRFSIGPCEAAAISTGGMLPEGTDSVVMIEHTEALDDTTLEVYRSVAPGHHVIAVGEDIQRGETVLSEGRTLRPQEIGLLAAFGQNRVSVFRQPVIGIISTGDEVVSIDQTPGPGQIRDINTYTLSGLITQTGGKPLAFGIVKDRYRALLDLCTTALKQSDMLLISGGSSVGERDFTLEALSGLPDPEILVHGISISPGKPTILGRSGRKAVWGLPGHVVSAMVVYDMVIRPFVRHLAGLAAHSPRKISARLSRNVSSAQGRIDYIRVRLVERDRELWAEPVLGKSGLIHTMVQADGLIAVGINTEGLDKGTVVDVIPL